MYKVKSNDCPEVIGEPINLNAKRKVNKCQNFTPVSPRFAMAFDAASDAVVNRKLR